jgi:hypothetical protein
MVDLRAPDPVNTSSQSAPAIIAQPERAQPSVVKVTIAACGGCGMNLGRMFAGGKAEATVLNFDTSMANSRYEERVNVVTNGNGSGSIRSENARDIERVVSAFTNEEIGLADVGIVISSCAGGSGSVIAPVIARDYARRGMRVVMIVVTDTSSTIAAKNTINTLKTMSAIANNAGLYLPAIILSNDTPKGRTGVDKAVQVLVGDLIELLTKPLYEVDRNDRLNFIDPLKVVGAKPGLKLMQLVSEQTPDDPQIIIGQDSPEIVDSLLIIQNSGEESLPGIELPMSRMKKVGFHQENSRAIVGKVTGDIKAVDSVIDAVERVQNIDQAQNYGQVDRLNTPAGAGDLFL